MQVLWFGPIELRTLHKILLERFLAFFARSAARAPGSSRSELTRS
jgi:hypothetical protein